MIHKIVYMKDISAGKNTFDRCFKLCIYHRSLGHGIHLRTRLDAQLILRNQTTGKQECITFHILFAARNWLQILIHFGNRNPFNPVCSMNFCHRMAEHQRYIIIIQTLRNISPQASRIWHNLCHQLHLRPLQGHTPCHNQTNISGS